MQQTVVNFLGNVVLFFYRNVVSYRDVYLADHSMTQSAHSHFSDFVDPVSSRRHAADLIQNLGLHLIQQSGEHRF